MVPLIAIDILNIKLVIFLYLMVLGALRPEFIDTTLAWWHYLSLTSDWYRTTAVYDFIANTS